MLYYINVLAVETGGGESALLLYALSVVSPTGFAIAIDRILVLDIAGVAVTAATLWSGPGMPLGASLLMMLVDLVLYAGLAVWLDAVWPGARGTRRPLCFCLDWRGRRQRPPSPTAPPAAAAPASADGSSGSGSLSRISRIERDSFGWPADDVEAVPAAMRGREAIRICGLRKVFAGTCRRGDVCAVDGIDLTCYVGQITAILGHNGAGKSTLFDVLTGRTAPTAGSVHMFGYDVW